MPRIRMNSNGPKAANLAYEIISVEMGRNYDQDWKLKRYIAIFEEWRKKSPVVDASVRGQTSFISEFDRMFNSFHRDGVHKYAPYLVEVGDRKAFAHLQEALGDLYIDSFSSLMLNPVFTGSAAAFNCCNNYRNSMRKGINRREFVKKSSLSVLFWSSAGGLLAAFKYGSLAAASQRAVYLDGKIMEVYRK